MLATPFAHEFQELKNDLQRALARLGATETARDQRYAPASPWSRASTTTTSTHTPTTVWSEATSGRTDTSSPIGQSEETARILRELVATARRRREVETHLARELERDVRVRDDARTPRTAQADSQLITEHHREQAIRREIEALRRHRKQILHQIDDESKNENEQNSQAAVQPPPLPQDRATLQEQELKIEQSVSNLSASITRRGKDEYSIQGVVSLGPLQHPSSTLQPAPVTDATKTSQPTYVVPPNAFQLSQMHNYSRQHNHDMMQDVFSIQLKFAETMLQLEKSIQLREQILLPSSTQRRLAAHRRHPPTRRRPRPPFTIHEDVEGSPVSSSDGNERRDLASSDEASLSEDTMRLWRRYRLGRQRTPIQPSRLNANLGASVATTTVSTTPDSQPSRFSPEGDSGNQAEPTRSNEDDKLTTPSTNDSSNKQVRFDEDGADEYPTPQIARNISFDQDSIDSSEDDDRQSMRRSLRVSLQPQQLSVPCKRFTTVVLSDDEALSFMEGSSVCSADLNDKSFLAAFLALRKELQVDRRPLYQSDNKVQLPLPTRVDGAKANATPADTETISVLKCVDVPTLMKQKRALALDIQSLTAKLVLAQDCGQRAQVSSSLDRLRRDLQGLDVQIAQVAR